MTGASLVDAWQHAATAEHLRTLTELILGLELGRNAEQ